jgi:hypothetical protein
MHLPAALRILYLPTELKRNSLLKNSFVLSSASEAGAENAVFVVFWSCFRALLDRRPGQHRLFQHAGEFSEVLSFMF